MYVRCSSAGDAQRARPFLKAANEQFHALAMTGWIRRIEETALLN
jgi:hypothetical protein